VGPAPSAGRASEHRPVSAFDPGPVLAALADDTRRAVFERVVHGGPLTATELAAERGISRQAVAKHLEVLDRAGLVRGERTGREVRFHADVGPLGDTADWLRRTGEAWDRRLARLQAATRRDRADD
jgi:DNA-binding transcriptional ArsR family regulator